ncbi:MAG: hypothetical protein QNJ23_06555 [Woeseiaceae bacterium]|nr:hypothetical protein [Woeseiaceae bacterium]
MLPLLRTLFDITLLRKGPDAIPASWILVLLVIGLWLFSSLTVLSLIEQFDERDFVIGLYTALAGIVTYTAILVVAGHASRAMQTVTAILGCGALISLIFVAEFVLFTPFLGPTVTGILAQLILLWSVPVEGHIIARALGRHWYIGIVIAIGVFVLQYVIYSAMAATT